MKSAPKSQTDSPESQLDQLYQTMGRLYQQLTENTEETGKNLAEEARKVHYHEAPRRSLRGVATPEEVKELSEEGIDLIPLPIPKVYNTEPH